VICDSFLFLKFHNFFVLAKLSFAKVFPLIFSRRLWFPHNHIIYLTSIYYSISWLLQRRGPSYIEFPPNLVGIMVIPPEFGQRTQNKRILLFYKNDDRIPNSKLHKSQLQTFRSSKKLQNDA